MSKKLPSGELENQVLEILWSHDHPMTPREVHDLLSAHRKLAYTTPMTILVRLWEKACWSVSAAGAPSPIGPS